jgi:hypothetical protein
MRQHRTNAIRNVPLFPLIPLVPAAIVSASLVIAVRALLRVRRLERQVSSAAAA